MPIIGFSLGIGKGIALPLGEAVEGRAVAAPAVDPDTMKKSAKVSAVAAFAREYGAPISTSNNAAHC